MLDIAKNTAQELKVPEMTKVVQLANVLKVVKVIRMFKMLIKIHPLAPHPPSDHTCQKSIYLIFRTKMLEPALAGVFVVTHARTRSRATSQEKHESSTWK